MGADARVARAVGRLTMTAEEHGTRPACRYASDIRHDDGTVTIQCARCGFSRTGTTWVEAQAAYLGETKED